VKKKATADRLERERIAIVTALRNAELAEKEADLEKA
jgi:hypothetical protein